MKFIDVLNYIFNSFLLQGGDDKESFKKLIEAIKKSKKGKTIGVFSKDKHSGTFMNAWKKVLDEEKFDTVSISVLFCYFFYKIIM